MDVTDPIPRSLIGIESVPLEQGGGILIKCDCATTTHLVVEILEGTTGNHEVAVTCDGCHTVRWLTIKLASPAPPSPEL